MLRLVTAAGLAALLLASGGPGVAQPAGDGAPSVPPEAWRTSPYHGALDGDGRRIPCLCRYRESDYRLGDTVCMNTHLGVQLARCDLLLNNTSWVPIGTPCTMSGLGTRRFSLAPRAAKLAANTICTGSSM